MDRLSEQCREQLRVKVGMLLDQFRIALYLCDQLRLLRGDETALGRF